MMLRLDLAESQRTKDAQQSGEQFLRESSSAVHGQLHGVTDLWLVQLPPFWQVVPVQHTRHSTHSRLVCPRCCQWTCPSDKTCQLNTHDTQHTL